MTVHEALYKKGLQKDTLLKTTRQALTPTRPQRTLTLAQTQQIVNNLHVTRPCRQDIDHSALQEAEELKLCTFKPSTTHYHPPSSNPSVKNY